MKNDFLSINNQHIMEFIIEFDCMHGKNCTSKEEKDSMFKKNIIKKLCFEVKQNSVILKFRTDICDTINVLTITNDFEKYTSFYSLKVLLDIFAYNTGIYIKWGNPTYCIRNMYIKQFKCVFNFTYDFDLHITKPDNYLSYSYNHDRDNLNDLSNFLRKLYITSVIFKEFPRMNKTLICNHFLSNFYLNTKYSSDVMIFAKPPYIYDHEIYMKEFKEYTKGLNFNLEQLTYRVNIDILILPKEICNIISSYHEV